MTAGLDIIGVGLDIPFATDTRALCRQAGADTTEYRGWDRVCVAHEDEHPSTMGAAALRSALGDAGISPADLGIVVSAGMSRDYPPSWSLSTEIMKATGTRPTALGIDLTLGCQGAEFVSAPEMNGRVLIKYGGTRYPAAPWGENAAIRTLSSSPRDAVRERYRDCYDAALTALTKRFGVIPVRLICNQITPGTVRMLTRLTGLAPSSVVVSGHDVGHIGPADIIVGFDRLRRADQLDGPVAVASSTPYSFGFGLITPPATPSAG